jgi:hypothetical protein
MWKYLVIIVVILAAIFFVIKPETIFSETLRKTILSNSPIPLTIPTYDGSGQMTHPDILFFSAPWKGFRYWMVGTPYPDENSSYENPSVFVSKDAVNWTVPNGLSNPLVKPAVANSYLSDPDIIYHRSFGIRVYYRMVDEDYNRIFFIESKNGKDWTQPAEIITLPNHQIISPAVTRYNLRYAMYSVKLLDNNTSTIVERRFSKDGINWSSPATVTVYNMNEVIWHLDVQYVSARKEFWLLMLCYPSSSLYVAISKDGLHFKASSIPLISESENPDAWDGYSLYRSTFRVTTTGDFFLWYAGEKGIESHIGFIKTRLKNILAFR